MTNLHRFCVHFLLPAAVLACNSGSSGTTSAASMMGTTDNAAETQSTATEDSGDTDIACAAASSLVGDCNVSCQNCSSDEKCVAFGEQGKEFSRSECRPIPEVAKSPGERCTIVGDQMGGDDDCGRGSSCVAFPLFPDGHCLEFCGAVGDELGCSDPSQRCQNLFGKAVCVPVCDPRQPGECDFGCRAVDLGCPGCFPVKKSGVFTCWYPPPEENTVGFPCPFGECSETLFCGPPGRVPGCDETTPCCTTYCDLDNVSCPDGTQCQPIFVMEAAPQGLEDLGSCLTP